MTKKERANPQLLQASRKKRIARGRGAGGERSQQASEDAPPDGRHDEEDGQDGQDPEPEMGWALYDGFEGQGYATEAATAARDWAKGRLASLVSYTHGSNARSVAVAERLGAVHDPDAPTPTDIDPATFRVYRHWGAS
jgi:RimJ/RimL family protein N-acetyltransferase